MAELIRVGINGFGRIGRNVLKIIESKDNMIVVGINDIDETRVLAHLLKYDSVSGRFQGTVEAKPAAITVSGRDIDFSSIKNPSELDWRKLSVDVVIESTGQFRKRAEIAQHLDAGAKKVILTVPAKDKIDNMIVVGVNNDDLEEDDLIVSNASCTTNCLAPMVKVLHENFGIIKGQMTTVHAYTNDQRLLDLPHKDLRRARAAAVNMIPTTTGAAGAIGEIMPTLKGKLDGMAIRVPVTNGSVVDFVPFLDAYCSIEQINNAMKVAAESDLKGILQYTEDPIVSSDIIGNPHSCVFDASATMLIEGSLAKVIGWYDNEWAYACRVVDLISLMREKRFF